MSLLREMILAKGMGGTGSSATEQTVNGTLTNPFVGVNANDLVSAISANNASAYVEIDMTSIGFGPITTAVTVQGGAFLVASVAIPDESGGYLALFVAYNATGPVASYGNGMGLIMANDNTWSGVNLYQYAEYIPTVATVIWHPLPT